MGTGNCSKVLTRATVLQCMRWSSGIRHITPR